MAFLVKLSSFTTKMTCITCQIGFFGSGFFNQSLQHHALHVFTPFLKLAISRRPMISRENGFHGKPRSSPKVLAQEILPSTHAPESLRKTPVKTIQSNYPSNSPLHSLFYHVFAGFCVFFSVVGPSM